MIRRSSKLDEKCLRHHAGRRYEEILSFVRGPSRDHRSDDSTSLRKQGGHDPVRKAYSASSNRDRSEGCPYHSQDKDGDDRRLFALDGRRHYADLRIVRSRQTN
jgi:hypothetical protein